MNEDTRAKEEAEEGKQPESMPSSETKEPKKPLEGAAEETVGSVEGEEPKLPEGVRERTRQEFDKLQQRLREERQRREQLEQKFASTQPQQPQYPQATQSTIDQFIDPMTGEVNVRGLNQAIAQTQQRAVRAEQMVQRYIEEQQSREAYVAYPQLNPDAENFDGDLHRRTRAFLLDSMMNPKDYGDKQLSFKEAAELASRGLEKAVAKAEEAGAKKALEQLTPKEQASLEAEGRSDRRKEAMADLQKLREKSRRGDLEAIVQRLKKVPEKKRG
ncbi:MAG: hypothetical protein FJ044_01275 [Candidatus Cloacimonetes bacterium]|nr:hypothetical protein [Candidatus Cloacimonadota bacterium]